MDQHIVRLALIGLVFHITPRHAHAFQRGMCNTSQTTATTRFNASMINQTDRLIGRDPDASLDPDNFVFAISELSVLRLYVLE